MLDLKEIENARKNAYSIPPGEKPPGAFIGNEVRNGITFHYYKTASGEYYYTSSLTDKIEMEIQAAKKKKALRKEKEYEQSRKRLYSYKRSC